MNGRPLVVIDGSGLPSNSQGPGLSATGGNITIKGLVIHNFDGDGILLSSGPGDTVQDCYIGTMQLGVNPATFPQPSNIGYGIDISAPNCTIGGTAGTATRNVIGGNLQGGIFVTGNRATIQGNYIGLGSDGATAVANDGFGIRLLSSVGDQIGGTAADAGNVISGNDFRRDLHLLRPDGAITGDVIQGNFIGTDATGLTAVGNGQQRHLHLRRRRRSPSAASAQRAT